jgi:hypothetical protein
VGVKSPRFVKAYTDRHGHVRRYYRRRGFPATALTGEPGTAEFTASYEAASALKEAQRRRASAKRCYIYVIQVRGFDLVKIGYSDTPERRLDDLTKGSGMTGGLEMLFKFRARRVLEKQIHHQLADQRLFGEWFRLSGPVQEWLDRISTEREEREARMEAAGLRSGLTERVRQ